MILYLSTATATMVREDMKAAVQGNVLTILKQDQKVKIKNPEPNEKQPEKT